MQGAQREMKFQPKHPADLSLETLRKYFYDKVNRETMNRVFPIDPTEYYSRSNKPEETELDSRARE
jgi:hypothetical protein